MTWTVMALCIFVTFQATGAEYFVNLQGNDGNDGWSRVEALLTIKKGVDALKAVWPRNGFRLQ